MGYVFANADHSFVIRTDDSAWIVWDVTNAQPADIDGHAGSRWRDAGSPAPDPYVAPVPTSQQQYADAVNAGVTLAWTVSTALNSTYALDQVSLNNIIAEGVSINMNNTLTNGQQQRYWLNSSGTPILFTLPQFKLFATAVAAYMDSLHTALAQGSTTWPSSTVAVTG
jgi:hypothetical protein